MRPSARPLKVLATTSLPRDVVALHTARIGTLVTAMRNRMSFKPFEIGTEVLSWNEHYFYVRHTFRSASNPDGPIATAYLTMSFPDESGTAAPTAMVRTATGEDVIPPLLDNSTRAKFGLSALPTTLAPAR